MKQPLLKQIGLKVKSARIEKGLSQETLAERAGLHRTYIGGIERGERNVTILNLSRVALALEISLVELFKK